MPVTSLTTQRLRLQLQHEPLAELRTIAHDPTRPWRMRKVAIDLLHEMHHEFTFLAYTELD